MFDNANLVASSLLRTRHNIPADTSLDIPQHLFRLFIIDTEEANIRFVCRWNSKQHVSFQKENFWCVQVRLRHVFGICFFRNH